jgi:hypothetical protein
MNCPTCHAKLLPVQGELFCLQCGQIVTPDHALTEQTGPAAPITEPILQRAVRDLRPDATFERAVQTPSPEPPNKPKPQFDGVAAVTQSKVQTTAPSPPPTAPPPLPTAPPPLPAALVSPSRPQAAAPSPPAPVALPSRPAVTGWHRQGLPAWVIGLVIGLSLLGAADGLARWYYHDRVYPGVKVADQALGGQSLRAVAGQLERSLSQDPIKLTINTTEYRLTPQQLGVSVDSDAVTKAVRASGRTKPLALLGVGETLVSQPLALEYRINDRVMDATVARLANENSHPAADAVPVIIGATPLILAEKAGQQVDQAKLKDSLLLALKRHQPVRLSTTRLVPALATSAYTIDIDDARTKLGLALSIKVRTRTVTPTPADLAGWLVFGDPGRGVRVDAGRIGAYLAAVPGTFDRAAAQQVIAAALAANQPLAYTATTRRNVAPTTVSSAAASPQATYTYCVAARGASDDQLAALARQSQAVLERPEGWALGGRIKLMAVPGGCNFTLWLAEDKAMSEFSTACNRQATCRSGNDVIMNLARWQAAPAEWKGTVEAYQTEMINHEVGHWLGFDHARCVADAPAAPVSQVTLTVAGCSPQWHPVPAELQGLKILPGF